MYYPQQQKEPSGCMETLLITKIVFSLLMVPFAMIMAAIASVVLALYALTVHPLLALLVVIGCGLVFIGFVKWEQIRITRNQPPPE